VPLAFGASALACSSYGQAEMATKFLGPAVISALMGGAVLLAKFATDRGHVIKPLLNKARTQLSGMLNAAALLKELLLLNEFAAKAKQPTVFPALVDHEGALFVAQDMGSPLHAKREGLVVSDPEELRNGVPKGKFVLNPAAITDDQIVLVIGPNSGGKTTWIKQLFSNLLLGQVGSRIFAAAGRLCPATKIAFSLPKQNSVDSEEGSFGEELAWVRPLLDQGVDKYAILGCDELGRGTGEIASAPIAMDILRTLQLTGVRIVLATHNSRLVESLQDGTLRFNVLHPEAVLIKQADDTQRIVLTKRILPGFPAAEVSPQAYAVDVARRLGIGPEQLEELRRAIISERN